MTTERMTIGHPASVDAYIRHGWSLVPIPPQTKGPRTAGWNLRENALKSSTDLPAGWGIGLAHAYSGTMALDVDDWDTAKFRLSIEGVDLDALYHAPDAVVIDSGRPGHGKLLYACPTPLRSKKLTATRPDGSPFNFLDFRCATVDGLTVQDVLPPSIHPDTRQPYRWGGTGSWGRLPTIPDSLARVWQTIINRDNHHAIRSGDVLAVSWNEIEGALAFINPSCTRADWVTVGMALHWAGNQIDNVTGALHLWDEWSRGSVEKYPGTSEILTQWRSFHAGKATEVTLGSLFHLARTAGWTRPVPDASSLFASISSGDSTPVSPAIIESMGRIAPPDMDLDLWPTVLRRRAVEVADSVGADPIVSLFAGLAAVCACADARTRLHLMGDFSVPPVLWLMTIGAPADKKSPASRPMLEFLRDLEAEDRPRFQKALLEWEAVEAAHASSKKAYLQAAASPDALLGAGLPDVVPLPGQPVPLRLTVSDITSQKLVRHASERPAGVLCYLDEMNAWVRKQIDKNSGEDRSTWVSGYESRSYDMDRVGAGYIHVENLAVSVYGNIQPAVYRAHVDALTQDGLLQRFVPAVLRERYTRMGKPVADWMTNRPQWEQTLRVVFGTPVQTYHLSPDAFNLFREFQCWYESSKQDERLLGSPDAFMTSFGKIEGTAGRFILLFHMIEAPFSHTVDVDIVRRVITLIKSYVIPALRYSLAEMGGIADVSIDKWVADYVIQCAGEMTTIELQKLRRSARRQVEGLSQWQAELKLMDAMATLEESRWVVKIDDNRHGRAAVWVINPAIATLYADHRKAVIMAKQRQMDYIRRDVLANRPDLERKMVKGYDPLTMSDPVDCVGSRAIR